MGHGIALTLARAGHPVAIFDPVPGALHAVRARIDDSLKLMDIDAKDRQGVPNKCELCNSIADAVASATIVFEAAPEKLPLKQQIFAEVEAHAPEEAIFASNTSVIQITRIMGGLHRRHRALGTHWWNPPHMIPLVEVIRTEWTDDASVEATMDLLADAGKTPVRVDKDVPGFIGNRLQHAMWREAISMVENGICDAAAVDTVVKTAFGRRLSVLGPLENADLVGTDLTLDIQQIILNDLENSAVPSPYLSRLVADGNLGMKSGTGFYAWTPGEADAVRTRVAQHLKRLDTILDD